MVYLVWCNAELDGGLLAEFFCRSLVVSSVWFVHSLDCPDVDVG